MKQDSLFVGTAKGLVEYSIGSQGIEPVEIHFQGFDISCIHQHFDGAVFVALNHKHWGSKLFYRRRGGKEWESLSVPQFSNEHLNVNGKPASLRQIWSLHDGGESYPNRLWAGVEPGALFISEDLGKTWKIVEQLWNHETRIKQKMWFGAGKDLPFVHSVLVHPEDHDTIMISVSCAGVFLSKDSGRIWELRNKGLKATYLPNPNPEAGYDPHILLVNKKNPSVIWQQNHCGIFNSKDSGLTWTDVSGSQGLPSYGFCLAIGEATQEAWVIPVEDETNRIPPGMKLRVFYTKDFGKTWVDNSNGLPGGNFFGIVLRNGFCKLGQKLAFGTTNGNLYFSSNKGKNWTEVSTSLAKVNYICFIKS